ncbi:MAG: hypothetical protein II943_13155 [Victivallales bacterium]|nr:hypothetical protein [Victivallales bacterium]
MSKIDTALFFTSSVIEFIGRQTHNRREVVVDALGTDVDRIYHYADVFHCEPIEKVADDFIRRNNIRQGDYDNIASCQYAVPSYWDIGKVFARLIRDCHPEDLLQGLRMVYHSFLANRITNFNSDLYYQPPDYLALCYHGGKIVED